MTNNAHSYLVLLLQRIHRLFCYYTLSPKTIEAYENTHGVNSWFSSITKLTLYYIENNIPKEKSKVFPPLYNNNWYFDTPEDNITAYVELSKVTPDNKCHVILSSNILTTPRDNISEDSNISFIDINNPVKIIYPQFNAFDSTLPFSSFENKNNCDFFIDTMRNLNFKALNSSK